MAKIAVIINEKDKIVYSGCTNCDYPLNTYLNKEVNKYLNSSEGENFNSESSLDLILERKGLECPSCSSKLKFGFGWNNAVFKKGIKLEGALK